MNIFKNSSTCRASIIVFPLLVSACAHQASEDQGSIVPLERASIEAVLYDYFEGTSVENPEQLRRAFHSDFNLYSVRDDGSLRVWNGQDYISNFEVGQTNTREGKIIAIDIENDVASAKAEILIPGSRVFTDYFLLAKYEGQWRIVQKSYTSRRLSEP